VQEKRFTKIKSFKPARGQGNEFGAVMALTLIKPYESRAF